jgi:DNA-binding NarL/FixJ family response regulator
MKRLLLVEDFTLFRQSLALLLEWRTGLSTVQASSPSQAIRFLDDSRGNIRLAIVDVDLREEEGVTLIARLHQAKNAVRVLALTTDADPTARPRALEAGAAEVLSTASGLEEIVEAIRRLEALPPTGAGGAAPDVSQEWELSDALRSALLGMALRPERPPHERLEGLKRHVEGQLWELSAIKRQRDLSDEERRQEVALRDLLTAIEEAEWR